MDRKRIEKGAKVEQTDSKQIRKRTNERFFQGKICPFLFPPILLRSNPFPILSRFSAPVYKSALYEWKIILNHFKCEILTTTKFENNLFQCQSESSPNNKLRLLHKTVSGSSCSVLITLY